MTSAANHRFADFLRSYLAAEVSDSCLVLNNYNGEVSF